MRLVIHEIAGNLNDWCSNVADKTYRSFENPVGLLPVSGDELPSGKRLCALRTIAFTGTPALSVQRRMFRRCDGVHSRGARRTGSSSMESSTNLYPASAATPSRTSQPRFPAMPSRRCRYRVRSCALSNRDPEFVRSVSGIGSLGYRPPRDKYPDRNPGEHRHGRPGYAPRKGNIEAKIGKLMN